MRTSSINHNIYNEIKRRILYFHYEPGQALSEKELAKEFEVSRTPIREALLRLEWEKLVTIMPRAAILVSWTDFQEARDIYHNRIFVEGSTGWFASKNIQDEHLARMEALVEACYKVRPENSRIELIEIDIQLRELLFEAAKSRANREISNFLYYQTLRFWFLAFEQSNMEAEVEIEAKEIRDSIEVFSKRDPEKGEAFKRDVILQYLERISQYFTAY